uniref:Kinesin motor domain-containing protein n=1 Tax=Kwoniella pini CBS 10737 TaxID=1296096 RepID=A0A1B9I9U2_9TREE|nr:uncharacterized protein I206_01546 [Kwoniella pini CBS 10737]OCF52260.1 hypothetical protein I206_01546 [Kwoniella pini CBS 10737]
MSSSKAIACHVRVRPSCATDGKINTEGIKIDGNSISAFNKEGDKKYHFDLDQCHDAVSTQEEVFKSVKPVIEQAFKGQSTTIFTYGVTGSGKTHTMQGTVTDPGIIPRTIEAVFQKQSESPSTSFSVSFSYVEILKDEVYDLLGDRVEPRKREIRMSPEGHNIVADLTVQPISSTTEFNILYDAAAKTRKTAATRLNSSSSRSHAILTIYLHHSDQDNQLSFLPSKICLTDLAGSENNNLTGNDKERMRESSAINTSLTTLGKVVDALNENAKKGVKDGTGPFIPYRESKLTRLLQDALGGRSLGLLICCLAPGEKFARDTINTLQFAKKSKSVENRLNAFEQNTRRISAPLPRASQSNKAAIKVHTGAGPRHSAPTGRIALSSVSTNIQRGKVVKSSSLGDIENGRAISAEKTKEEMAKGLTDEQLSHRIVSEQMAMQKELIHSKEAGTIDKVELDKENEFSLITDEEKDKRARVIVSHARKAHHSGDLQQALKLYRKAYEYVPFNRKLSMRITEIELSIEGIIPCEKIDEQEIPKSGMKRSHGHLDSLADLSYEESPAKKGKC